MRQSGAFRNHAGKHKTGLQYRVLRVYSLSEFQAVELTLFALLCVFSQDQSSPSQIITTMTTTRRRSSAGDAIGIAPGFATYPRRASRVIANVLSHKMADVTTPLPGWPNNKDEYELGQVIGK